MAEKMNFLDFKDAVKKSLDLSIATTFTEMISIGESIGRIIAKDVVCVKNLPSFNNSAMDGFAFKFEDAGKVLTINKTIFAGDKGEKVKESLLENECYKIMTGAKVPNDVDTIVPIENCFDLTSTTVRIPNDIKKGANLRLKGEEQKEGNI